MTLHYPEKEREGRGSYMWTPDQLERHCPVQVATMALNPIMLPNLTSTCCCSPFHLVWRAAKFCPFSHQVNIPLTCHVPNVVE